MGQYWDLLNLSTACSAGSGGKLVETFTYEGLGIDIRHFIIPSWSDEAKSSLCSKYPWITYCSVSPKSNLLRLPDELLSAIFKHILSLADAVCLCLADGRTFAAGFSRVLELQAVAYANWAGHHVIQLGDYTQCNDLPRSVQELCNSYLEKRPEDASEIGGGSFWLSIVDEDFKPVHRCRYSVEHLRSTSRNPRDWSAKGFGKDWKPYREMMVPKYESSHPWVLCNISKGEYIRASVIAALTDMDESKPFISTQRGGTINLGYALLSQICWSSDPSTSMRYDSGLCRGRWAGDEFEVTSMDKLDPQIAWRDISKRVARLLKNILKSEHGENWKKKFC